MDSGLWSHKIDQLTVHYRVSHYVYALAARYDPHRIGFLQNTDATNLIDQQRTSSFILLLTTLNGPRDIEGMLSVVREMDLAGDTAIFAGVVYLHRVLRILNSGIPLKGIEMLFIMCVYIGSKVYEDDCYNLLTFCLVSGLQMDAAKCLEIEILRILRYKLIIPAERMAALEQTFWQPDANVPVDEPSQMVTVQILPPV